MGGDQVTTLVHAYNYTITATWFSPYFPIFGRHPRLALDVTLGVKFADMESVNTKKYVDKLKSHLKWASKVTHETNLKEIKRYKRRYDRDIRCSKLETRNLVMVRQNSEQDGECPICSDRKPMPRSASV